MNFLLQHKIAVGIAAVILAIAAWYEFTQTAPAAPVLSTTAVGGDSNPSDQTLISTLLQLQAVTLSGTILSDPGFLSLKDFTTQIVPEPVGRPNPFAPVSASILQSVAQTTVNPNLFAPTKH